MPLDFTKPIQTRDGRKVRILCQDAKSRFPVVTLVDSGDVECVYRYSADGICSMGGTAADLINVPPPTVKRQGWVNVYPKSWYQLACEYRPGMHIYLTREEALRYADGYVVDTVPIEFSVPAE